MTCLLSGNVTDLLVISHGWNNDMNDARNLYERLVTSIVGQAAGTKRKLAVLAVLWPSKKFAEKDLTAGGAAGFDPNHVTPLQQQLKDLYGFFDDADAAKAILDKATIAAKTIEKNSTDKEAQKAFCKSTRITF